MKLSHRDLVKWGRNQAEQGQSLNKIEADFLKKGIKKEDALKALDEVDYYNKIEKSKHKEAPKQGSEAVSGSQPAVGNAPASGKKSLFWPLIILFLIIGVIVYLFYSGRINLDWLRSVNLK